MRPRGAGFRNAAVHCMLKMCLVLSLVVSDLLCRGPQVADALIHELQVSGDNRRAFHIESFSFVDGGVADLSVKSFGIWPIPSKTSSWKMGFVFRKVASESDAVASIDEVSWWNYVDVTVFSLCSRL